MSIGKGAGAIFGLMLLAASVESATLKQFVAAPDPTNPNAVPLGFTPATPISDPASSGFRTHDAVIAAMDGLTASGLVTKLSSFGTTPARNKPILAYKITAPGNTRRNDPAAKKPQIAVIGGTHAREWIGVEAAARFAAFLVSQYDAAPANSLARYLLENAEVYVLPSLNADGVIFTQEHPVNFWQLTNAEMDSIGPFENPSRHGRMRRKNLQGVVASPDAWSTTTFENRFLEGVDLNRNMAKSAPPRGTSDLTCAVTSDNTLSLTYYGPSGQSSPEAKAVASFLSAATLPRLRAVVDAHAAGAILFGENISGLPGVGAVAGQRRDARTQELVGVVASALNQASPLFKIYAPQLCSAVGSVDDYAGVARLVPSYTMELAAFQQETLGDFLFVQPHSAVGPITSQANAGFRATASWAARDPYLKKVLIKQDGGSGSGVTPRTIYQDEIKSEPGGRSPNVMIKEAASTGRLEVRLEFSMPMKADVHPTVKLILGEIDASFTPVGTGWATTVYENDTWIGELASIPAGMEGEVTLAVDAIDDFNGKIDGKPLTVRTWAEGDWTGFEDENGAGSDGGRDTRVAFTVDTTPPTEGGAAGAGGEPLPGGHASQNICLRTYAKSSGSGICKIWTTCPGMDPSTTTFPTAGSPASVGGNACQVTPGECTVTAVDCAGNESNFGFSVDTGTTYVEVTGSGGGWSDSARQSIGPTEILTVPGRLLVQSIGATGNPQQRCEQFETMYAGETLTCNTNCSGGCEPYYVGYISPVAVSNSFTITNTTDTATSFGIHITGGTSSTGALIAFPDTNSLDPGQSISGTVTLPQVPNSTWTARNPTTVAFSSPLENMVLAGTTTIPSAAETARQRQVLQLSSPKVYDLSIDSGVAIFNSTMAIVFSYQDTVGTDTDTLRVYRFDGSNWESDSITNQSVEVSSLNVITLSGISTQTALYGAFFDGSDSSAPITSISVIGSTYTFDGTVFLSTDSLIVLTSTDPVVNGFASGVATISYRINPEAGTEWSVYDSSIPLTVGVNFVEYRAEDYAGNIETVQVATYAVTAGTTFKDPDAFNAEAAVLIGFLDSGAQFEVEARTQNDYVLRASSADGTPMQTIDNIGNWGIGTDLANGTIEISSVAPGGIALQLRSGNSTGSWTSSQIAFGYDGESSMRHLIKSRHYGADAQGNAMRFLVWSPGLDATAVATTTVLSLEAISGSSGAVHVMPGVDLSSANLTVSNGSGLGEGQILAAYTASPSSIRFKEGVRALGEDDYARAYDEVMGLRHADYRYKSDPAREYRGLIYEDSPESVRGPGETLSFDQRLVNIEMALRRAAERYESLVKRLKRLEVQP